MKIYKNVDEYIADQPVSLHPILEEIRETIQKAAPEADECISYGMPAYKMGKALVYFAAAKNHIGFYPTPSGVREFTKELQAYKTSKGAIQFPLDKPIPFHIIKKITEFRVSENQETLWKK